MSIANSNKSDVTSLPLDVASCLKRESILYQYLLANEAVEPDKPVKIIYSRDPEPGYSKLLLVRGQSLHFRRVLHQPGVLGSMSATQLLAWRDQGANLGQALLTPCL